MQQLEIEVLYNLECASTATMFDLRDVVTYIAKRVGLRPGRVWFGAGYAINVKFTAQQRRNFLRFLNRHGLKRFLVLDDFHKKQPKQCIGKDQTCPCQDGDMCHYEGPSPFELTS